MLWKIGPSIFNHKTGWHNKRTRTSTPRDPDLRTYNFEVFGVQGFINNANISFENLSITYDAFCADRYQASIVTLNFDLLSSKLCVSHML